MSGITHEDTALVRHVAKTWGLAVAVGALYAVWVAGLPTSGERLGFYLWIAGMSAAPSLFSVMALVRSRHVVVGLLTSLFVGPLTGFAVAYGCALITYGSGAEDGTVWRGIGGAVLGVVSVVAAWVVMAISARRAPRVIRA